VRLTVLGGCGGWPAAGEACSGYLVEHEGFWLLIDPGYAVLPQLLLYLTAEQVDAVLISHGHPDHCADLNPLLRARALQDRSAGAPPIPPLPIHSLPGATDAVLALDRPGMLDDPYQLHEFEAGQTLTVGPFEIVTRALPHSRPNVGVRVMAGGVAWSTPEMRDPTPDSSNSRAAPTCSWPRRRTWMRCRRTTSARCRAPAMPVVRQPKPESEGWC